MNSGHVVVFRQMGLFSDKMVAFGQKWLFSGKVVVSGQNCFYSGKVVVFGQSGSIRAMWLYSCKSCCIRAKVVVLEKKMVLIGQKDCTRAKVVVFG